VVVRNRRRPAAPGPVGPGAVAEIAMVGGRNQVAEGYFLDVRSRTLAVVPGEGFTARDFRTIADAAGLEFGRYRLSGTRRQVEQAAEALFPRVADYRKTR
jgi:hypothetical protein